jgi:uncharacterized protein YegP (UPF0339 family)
MGKTKLEVYFDEKHEYRWRVKAGNGRILADSGEGYKNYGDCMAGFAGIAELYTVYVTPDGTRLVNKTSKKPRKK